MQESRRCSVLRACHVSAHDKQNAAAAAAVATATATNVNWTINMFHR